MTSTTDIAELHNTAVALLHQRMSEFEAHLQSASTVTDLGTLHKDYAAFKEHVWGVLTVLQQQATAVSNAIDVVEMRHRKKFLLLRGLSEEPDEKIAERVISVFHSTFGMVDLGTSSLTTCHRLGTASDHPRPILMRFADPNTKAVLWKSKAKLKGTTLVLSEFLTRQRQTAFITARKLFGVSNVWTIDGTIHVKLPDNTRQRVFSCEEVAVLGTKYNRAVVGPPSAKPPTQRQEQSSKRPSPPQVSARPKRTTQKNK